MSLLSLDQIKTLYDDLRGRIEDGGSVINFLPVDNASGSIATFPDGADDVPAKSLIAQITPLQSGTGDPAPDNIRPISGWTGAKITDNGINQWDETWELGGLVWTTGAELAANDRIRTDYVVIESGKSYYIVKGSATQTGVVYYDENKAYISGNSDVQGITQAPANAKYIRVVFIGITTYTSGCSINCPSTDTTYHAYNGSQIDVSWADEGTVYGGTLTYIGGGKYSLQATKKKDTFTWADGTNATVVNDYTRKNFALTSAALTASGMASNIAPFMQGQTSNPVPHTDFSTSSVARVYLPTSTDNATSIELLYAFATLPDPIILDAEDVKTLLGDNNIFVDTGDVSVDYRADIALYIQKVVNA